MKSKIFLNFFIILFLTSFPQTSFAEEFDTGKDGECTPFWNPRGCTQTDRWADQMNARSQFAGSTGVGSESAGNPTPTEFRGRRVTIGRIAPLAESLVRGRVNTRGDVPTTPTSQNPGEGNGNDDGNGFQFPQNNQQGGGMNPSGIQTANVGKGLTKANGMIYSDDEPETGKIDAGQASPPPSTYQQPQLNAVAANKATDTGGGSGNDSAGRSPTSVAGNGVQGFVEQEGANPNPAPAGSGGITGALQSLASAMGEKFQSFMGGSEGGGSVFASDRPRRNGRRGKNGRQPASTEFAGANLNEIRDRFGNIIRNTASRLEFGRANEHMFQGMCSHYAKYAAQNRIPYDRASCESF